MGGDVSLASSLDVLERRPYTVASCKAPGNICPHEPVHLDEVTVHVQARQQIGRRELLPQEKQSIGCDSLATGKS